MRNSELTFLKCPFDSNARQVQIENYYGHTVKKENFKYSEGRIRYNHFSSGHCQSGNSNSLIRKLLYLEVKIILSENRGMCLDLG